MEKQKSTWGGARRSGITKKKVQFTLDLDLTEKLKSVKNSSGLVNELLKKHFENKS